MPEQIKFKKGFFGIKEEQVADYVNGVSAAVQDKLYKKDSEIAELKNKIAELELCNKSLKNEIESFKEEKKKISDVFLKAEEKANTIVDEAKEKAKNIIEKSKEENEKLISELNIKLKKKQAEYQIAINKKQSELAAAKNEISGLKEKTNAALRKFNEILGQIAD